MYITHNFVTVAKFIVLVFATSGLLVEGPAISVSPTSFDVYVYPGGQKQEAFTLSNAGSVDIEVTYTFKVTGPSPLEITVEFTPMDGVIVPAGGSVYVVVTVKASKGITPGKYAITISWVSR